MSLDVRPSRLRIRPRVFAREWAWGQINDRRGQDKSDSLWRLFAVVFPSLNNGLLQAALSPDSLPFELSFCGAMIFCRLCP